MNQYVIEYDLQVCAWEETQSMEKSQWLPAHWPAGELLQVPALVVLHLKVDLVHSGHHPNSLDLAVFYRSHDRSPALVVLLVELKTRDGQQLVQADHVAGVAGQVQGWGVLRVLGVHLDAGPG